MKLKVTLYHDSQKIKIIEGNWQKEICPLSFMVILILSSYRYAVQNISIKIKIYHLCHCFKVYLYLNSFYLENNIHSKNKKR